MVVPSDNEICGVVGVVWYTDASCYVLSDWTILCCARGKIDQHTILCLKYMNLLRVA